VFTPTRDASTVGDGPRRHDQLVIFDVGTSVEQHVALLEIHGRDAACYDVGACRREEAGERNDGRLETAGWNADQPRPVDDLGLAGDDPDGKVEVPFPQSQGDLKGTESAADNDDAACHAPTPAAACRMSVVESLASSAARRWLLPLRRRAPASVAWWPAIRIHNPPNTSTPARRPEARTDRPFTAPRYRGLPARVTLAGRYVSWGPSPAATL